MSVTKSKKFISVEIKDRESLYSRYYRINAILLRDVSKKIIPLRLYIQISFELLQLFDLKRVK